MKALVIGSGGREHALAWKLAQSPSIDKVYCAPGNGGAALDVSCIPGDALDAAEMASLAETLGAAFTVVGPEAPLVAGVADAFAARSLPLVGPSQAAAQLEGSKVFSKAFFAECGIPTGKAVTVESPGELDAALEQIGVPAALKADGLAAGKGVILVHDMEAAREQGRQLLAGGTVGDAGKRLLVEEFLTGREVSFIVLTDGERIFEFRPTQDHKRAFDNDEGPNTGGMGAFCDDSILSPGLRQQILDTVIEPALAGMRRRGTPFRGFLYAGIILTADGPKTLEFNVRLGDPETQPLLYRLEGDFGELLASAARGSLDPSLAGWKAGAAAAVVMASGGYPGGYAKGFPIEGLAAAETEGAKVFHAGTLFKNGRLVTSGGRVLAATAHGPDLAAALDAAYFAVERIRFENAFWRRDIGRRALAPTS